MINVILQFLELDLVNINVFSKFYQYIPNGLRVKFQCFQNLNLGKTSTNPKCHLTTSWATSCQYQCMQNFITIFHSVQEIGPYSLFQNLELDKIFTNSLRTKSSQTVRWQNQMFDYRALYEIQLQVSVDFLRVVQLGAGTKHAQQTLNRNTHTKKKHQKKQQQKTSCILAMRC